MSTSACTETSVETDRPEHLHARQSDVECCETAAAPAIPLAQIETRTSNRDTSGSASDVLRKERDKRCGSPDM
jgi:hypothetical protein